MISQCAYCTQSTSGAGVQRGREAIGIPWMTRDELSQAIPPAYTEFIGRQLIAAITEAA